MALYPRPVVPGTDAYAASRALFDALLTRLGDPQMAAHPEHAVEEFITGAGRDVLKQTLQDHLDARAMAEPRLAEVAGTDQVVRRRAEPGHTRLLTTTLGRVEVTRIAYRAPAVSNLHPADVRLALPDGRYSYPLQKAVVHETVTGALREARDGLARVTGQQVGTQQLMQITIEAAHDVRDFYQQHTVGAAAARPAGGEPAPRDLLVLSIDATGVNMIDSGLREAAPARATGPQPPSAQLACRERTGRTRMAVVTALYDAAPAIRAPADILPTGAAERVVRRPGPKARNRELNASVADSTIPMTTRLFDRAQQRDPQHQRRWIVLVVARHSKCR
jgi:phage tail protein X